MSDRRMCNGTVTIVQVFFVIVDVDSPEVLISLLSSSPDIIFLLGTTASLSLQQTAYSTTRLVFELRKFCPYRYRDTPIHTSSFSNGSSKNIISSPATVSTPQHLTSPLTSFPALTTLTSLHSFRNLIPCILLQRLCSSPPGPPSELHPLCQDDRPSTCNPTLMDVVLPPLPHTVPPCRNPTLSPRRTPLLRRHKRRSAHRPCEKAQSLWKRLRLRGMESLGGMATRELRR